MAGPMIGFFGLKNGNRALQISSEHMTLAIDPGICPDPDAGNDPTIIDWINSGNLCDAVLFSHIRKEYFGIIEKISEKVPLYISENSKEMLLDSVEESAKSILARSILYYRIEAINPFYTGENFAIGDIDVTPIRVENGEYDTHILLLKADGKTVLYTGDTSTHGTFSNDVQQHIRRNMPDIDIFICEGSAFYRKL